MLVRPQAPERRARTECALALNKIVSDMMRETASLTRVAAHVQNPDKSTPRAIGMLRRYLHHHGPSEDVEHVVRALERGRAPKSLAKRRKRRPNHNGSAEVVSLHTGGAAATASPPIYESALTPDERRMVGLYRGMAEDQRESFMLAGKGLADPRGIAARMERQIGPSKTPDDGPVAG